MKLCGCGCDQEVVQGSSFRKGHFLRVWNPMDNLKYREALSKSTHGVSKSLIHKTNIRIAMNQPEVIEVHRIAILGSRNPNYRDGCSNEPWPPEFNEKLKEQIRDRDNHICQLCGVPQAECIRRLDVHHIDYVKENLDWYNLISLCVGCNSLVNHNREYWTKYFEEYIFELYKSKSFAHI